MTKGFTIFVEDREFRVDAERYARESEFMRAVMGGSFIESSRQCVTLHDLAMEDWIDFYHYIEGTEKLGPRNAEAVYYVADRFGFERARSDVESLLIQDMKITHGTEWEEFAIRMLQLINRFKDRRSRMFREKLICVLEKSNVNVGRSIQEGHVMYHQ